MRFNIVLFHFKNVSLKIDLYKKCYDSIEKAFPKDNIIVFNSIDEVYEKYNIPKISTEFLFETDYVRLYLSKYLKNMIWFDSDIDLSPCPGFRNIILSIIKSNPDKDFISFSNAIGCFFSRKENIIINNIINNFDFKVGDVFLRKEFLPRENIFNLDRCYNHYFCLNSFMNELSNEKEFLIVDFSKASYDDLLHGMQTYDFNKSHKYKIVFAASYSDYMITQDENLKVLFTTLSKEELTLYIEQSQKLRNNIPTVKVIPFKENY